MAAGASKGCDGEHADLQEAQKLTASLLGHMARSDIGKDKIRDSGALKAMLQLLGTGDKPTKEACLLAIGALAINNEMNQDYIRCELH